MPTVKLTSIICNGFSEPLPIELFFENNSFSPSSGVNINTAEPILLNMEANYSTDGHIVVCRNGEPILKSKHSFTLLDSGAGATDFHGFDIQDDTHKLLLKFDVSG